MLDALTSTEVYEAYVKLPTINTPVPEEIRSQKKFFPFFKGCIGALDGTHIPAHVPELQRASYRNRKGQVSQNVLAASSMDMRFVYVLPGWEGSASDSRVYEDARTTDFKVPEGRYYLADAGYGSCDALLVPYRGVRYHLKEWGQVGDRYASHPFETPVVTPCLPAPRIIKSFSTIDTHSSEMSSSASLASKRNVSRF